MRNLEIKYRLNNPISFKKHLKKHREVEYQFIHYQKDIYFDVPHGRLKIRVEEEQRPELIRYRRADQPEARLSQFSIEKLDNVSATLRELQTRFGIDGQVEKWRELYLFRNVRIHVDNVVRLGWFVEFESQISRKFPEKLAQSNLEEIEEYLQTYLVYPQSMSYIDLIKDHPHSAEGNE